MGKKVLPVTRSLRGCVVNFWPHHIRRRARELFNSFFCEGCEFVRLLSEDGRGYCRKHGDIKGGPSDD